MSTGADFTSSIWGVARGLTVHSLIYPLEVIKIRQQCLPVAEKSYKVAWDLFQKEGVIPFYKGLSLQLLKASVKQAWCWPVIIDLPHSLKCHGVPEALQPLLTGLIIATIDAAITTPLERSKIWLAFTGKGKFSLRNAYKDGWRGFTAHWSKLSVNWSTFLIAQKHLRNRYQQNSEQPLTLPQLAEIGVQVAMFVSVCSAPLDFANTLKQVHNRNLFQLFQETAARNLFRGWPLSALSLAIHNIASVIVIDQLSSRQHER